MIRGEGTALGFEEAGNAEFTAIIDFQARISAAAESSISVSVQAASLEFQDSLNIDLDSSLHIEGAINYLRFAGGVHLAPGSSASFVSSTDRSIKVALGTPWYAIDPTYNQGSFTLQVRSPLSVSLGLLPGSIELAERRASPCPPCGFRASSEPCHDFAGRGTT